MSELIERLHIMDAEQDSSRLRLDAIDALEAQAREITNLQAQLDARRNIDRYVSFVLAGDEAVNPQDAADVAASRLAAAERDAGRYRWLRDNNWLNDWIKDGSVGEWPGVIDRNIDADREAK